MAVRVVNMGAETKEVSFSPNMTLAQALTAAGVVPTNGTTLTVDGKTVKDPNDRLRDSAKVVVTPRVSNG